MMMEMNLTAETDRHKEAWLQILPKLWEFTPKIPNIIEQFEEDIELDELDNLDEGKQNVRFC